MLGALRTEDRATLGSDPNAAAGITVSGSSLPSPISFSYDAASRVTQEALNNTWSVSYGYDTAGNRTSVNDGTIARTLTYTTGNREATVSNNIDPLGYDYKGNVISRMTLDGTKTYHYGWDAFDRLTSATQMWSGGATVGYDYDALGRLLRRAKASAAGTSTTINYWLGLNKLSEERIVDDGSTAVVRPDSEASYPEANGWGFYDIGWDFTLQYDEDSVRGQVLTLAAIGGAASMIVGDDNGENYNPNATAWAAQGRRQLGFWFKNDDATPIEITVFGRASSGYGTLVFDTGTGTDYADSGNGCYVYYLGNANRFPTMNDGNWHYIELDLGAYQKQFSGVSGALTHVDGLAFTLPEDCQIQLDDIILSAGAMERSYGLGYTGAQTGSTGAHDVNSNAQCVSAFGRYYYHFSDLGTVMATSTANGGTLGAYEPDFFGNYRNVSGYKPDGMGITSKFYDADSDITYFGFRWHDPSRGRWISKEPSGIDGPNLYHYVYNDIVGSVDYNGKNTIVVGAGIGAEIGSFFPGPGTVIGAGIGGAAGTILLTLAMVGIMNEEPTVMPNIPPSGLALPNTGAGVSSASCDIQQAFTSTIILDLANQLEPDPLADPSKIPPKCKGLYEVLVAHMNKFFSYMNDPYAADNTGILKNAPTPEIRDSIIRGRLNNLIGQINNFMKQLRECMAKYSK